MCLLAFKRDEFEENSDILQLKKIEPFQVCTSVLGKYKLEMSASIL